MEIIFVRHGRTDWNGVYYQGLCPEPLNSRGVQEAKELTKKIQDLPIDCIWSSDVVRAVQTAQYIGKVFEKKVETKEFLREFDLGKWEGLTFDEIDLKWPGAMMDFYEHPEKIAFPQGENWKQIQKRVELGVEILQNIPEGQHWLWVSHEGYLRMLLTALGVVNKKEWSLACGEFIRLKRKKDCWQIDLSRATEGVSYDG
ncbi:MAG: histidine phosphatase family protein [Negativicutes bacterium]|nr:histidine phosphatase family protein [Negativicutes bacterium]